MTPSSLSLNEPPYLPHLHAGPPGPEASGSSGEGALALQQLLKQQEQPQGQSDPHEVITKWLDGYLASQKEEEQRKAVARLQALKANNGGGSSSGGGQGLAPVAADEQQSKGKHVDLLELREVQVKKLTAGTAAAALGIQAPTAVAAPPCELGPKEGPARRSNLIIAPVGDSFNASM